MFLLAAVRESDNDCSFERCVFIHLKILSYIQPLNWLFQAWKAG